MHVLKNTAIGIAVILAIAFSGCTRGSKHTESVPAVSFESKDGGTQVYMGKDLIVEFRENRYLRFRATNANKLWVGSERRPMDLCWAYADNGINDFKVKSVKTTRGQNGFEIKITADKLSLNGEVTIGLKAVWSAQRGGFEYFLSGDLDFEAAKFYENSKTKPNPKKANTIEATDWHIENISAPDRLMSKKPNSENLYDWFIFTKDQDEWVKSGKVHIVYVTRKGSYPTIQLCTLKNGGAMGWVDKADGGWLVYPQSNDANQSHEFVCAGCFSMCIFICPVQFRLATRPREIICSIHCILCRSRRRNQIR